MEPDAVDRERILAFLREVGDRFHASRRAELFLAGSAGLVLAGVRPSVDLDFSVQAPARAEGGLLQMIRQVAREMGIAVEIAPPDHFIPLPEGWRERSPSVGRFGGIDAFEFDPYSVSLSKLERGQEQDFQDVADYVRLGKVEMSRLRGFAALLPERYDAGPWSFRRGEDADSLRVRLAAGLERVGESISRTPEDGRDA